ncbi:hypothetical protein LTR53_016430, partial [Teratosphaeriaceae sp. CCFEE 6253]
RLAAAHRVVSHSLGSRRWRRTKGVVEVVQDGCDGRSAAHRVSPVYGAGNQLYHALGGHGGAIHRHTM